MSPSSFRDVISICDLSLRTDALADDLWQRSNKSQPLLCSLSIQTDVSTEATSDSLSSDSLNYGTVAKAVERTVNALPSKGTFTLEEIAESIVVAVLFTAGAPNVRLELSRPRALLSAEAVGIRIYRSTGDYSVASSSTPPSYSANSNAPNLVEDVFFVRGLKKSVVIGLNPCERLHDQEIVLDLEFGSNPMSAINAIPRAGWAGWRSMVGRVETHLSNAKPLTIEAIVTDLAKLVLVPMTETNNESIWDVQKATIRISKPSALMFARYPSVQVTRFRTDLDVLSSQNRAYSTCTSNTLETENTKKTSPESHAKHRAVLGVGSNMGDRVGYISKALRKLQELGSTSGHITRITDTSFLYESQAMYVEDQDHFLNAVAEIETTHQPLALLELAKSVEAVIGRRKTIKNGPRVIDLDILYFDSVLFNSRVKNHSNENVHWLQIPHASIAEREFVLQPLTDLSSQYVHPLTNKSSEMLLSELYQKGPSTMARVVPLSAAITHQLGQRTLIMSVLNTTPDSFSDGGDSFEVQHGLNNALRHIELGADILDIGGMSTRPGALDITEEEEISRVVPLIQAIRRHNSKIPISIDTFRAKVARSAIEAGATMINDVLGGSDKDMLPTMAELDVPVVIMHSRGSPQTMAKMTEYGGDVVAGLRRELEDRVLQAVKEGVKRWNIIVDPGIGFAKTGSDNLTILRRLPELFTGSKSTLNRLPILVGLSRKKFIGDLTNKEVAKDRIWGTAAGVTASIVGGADIVRIHDISEMRDVVRVTDAIYRNT